MSTATRHVDFMHDVSRQLAGSLNVRRAPLEAPHLAVREVGDWVMVARFDGGGATLTSWDGALARTATVRLLSDSLRRIRRVGQTELLHVAGGALIAVRGHGRGYDETDVKMVEEFAGRVAVTLDAARLYEERTHIATTLRAGAPDDVCVVIGDVRGTVVGVLPDLTYREVELRLGPGDAMLLFTDGVHEARARDDFFGMTRLRELLSGYAGASPETLCEAVEQRVVEHLDGAEHDDIALLAIRSGD